MSRLAIRIGVLTLMAGSVLGAQQPSQTPPPTFRAGVDIVYVDVSVLDGHRKPVRGLTAADFVVKEDGKVRPVVAFTPVTIPPPATTKPPVWAAVAPPDVVTNANTREGRLVIILLDHSIPIGFGTTKAREVATAVLDELAPGDLAAVTYASAFARQGSVHGFTADRARLLAAINGSFFGSSEAPGMSAADPSGAITGLDENDPHDNDAICYCGVCMLESVTRVADAVRDVPLRRKSLVLIASGAGVYITSPIGITVGARGGLGAPAIRNAPADCGVRVDKARTEMLEALKAANLTVQAFDPTGLQTNGSRNEGLMREVGLRLERQDVLQTLAEQTGGRSVTNTNDPAFRVPEVFDESEAYYVLGIERTGKSDGRTHSLDVQVNRSGVNVSARRSYVEGGGTPAAPRASLRGPDRLIAGPLPEDGVPLSIAVAPFAAQGKETADVAVVIGVRRPVGDVPATRPMQFLTAAFGPKGENVIEFRQRFAVTPPPVPAGDLEYDVISRLPLKPGRYEVRVGVQPEGAAGGSVYATFDVPDFRALPTSMSGILLSTAPRAPLVPDDGLSDLTSLRPTTRRDLLTTDRATALVRIYQGGSSPMSKVQVAAKLLDSDGRSVADETAGLDALRFDPKTRAADYRFELPLSRLAAGEYLLALTATAGARSVRRDLTFSVK